MAVEFRPLASGSGGNAYWISDGVTPLLLDAGIPWRRIRERTGFRTSELAGVLLSHCHGDHSAAAEDALRAGIDVWATAETLATLGLGGHRANVLEPHRREQIGTWSVLPFEVPHDTPGTVGFLLGSAGEKWVYVTDAAYVPYTFRGLTGIAVECNHSVEILRRNVAEGRITVELKNRILRSHMALERLLEFLQANDLSRLQMTILIHLSDNNSDEAGFKAAVQRATGRPVYVARA